MSELDKLFGTIITELYACRGCGFISTKNFRDGECSVCKRVATPIDKLELSELGMIVSEAPHTEED